MRERVKSAKTVSLIIILVLIPFFVFSQNFGTSTAEFLKIKPEAGPAGMGEAYIAVADGTEALIYNPAGLALMDRGETSFTEIMWFNNIYMHYLTAGYPLMKGSTLALNVLYIDFGSFNSTGDSSVPSIAIQDMLFSFGYGQSVADNLHLGITAKGMYENFFGNTAFGTALDAGVTWNVINKFFNVGAAIKNIGFVSGTTDPIPMEAGIGASIRLYDGTFDYFNVALDASKILSTDNIFAGLGFEYYVMKLIAFRLGFKYNNALDIQNLSFSDIQKLAIVSGGIGITVPNLLSFDYSFSPMGDIGVVNRVSLKFAFGESATDRYFREKAKKSGITGPKSIEIPKMQTEDGEIKAVSFKPQVPTGDVKEWSLSIKTSDGKIVKTFTGVGEVPKNLTWDGTDKFGKISASTANLIYDFEAKSMEGKTIASNIGKIELTKKFDFVKDDERYIPVKNEEMLVVPVTMLVSTKAGDRKEVPFIMVNKKIKSVEEWLFTVGDAEGNVIKTYKGKGGIPSYLVWDGRDAAGNYIYDVKQLKYSLKLTGDSGRQAEIKDKTEMTQPFVISSKNKEIRMSKKLYFEPGNSEIPFEMDVKLEEIAAEIKSSENCAVYIQGHSSTEGDKDFNMKLSYERAKKVLRILVEAYKIVPETITATGYGEEVPVADNNTDEGKMKNRRVEIVIIKQ